MKVAIIGAGLFGITAALELDAHGHQVTVFERLPDMLQAASGINQYRLHRGYHYPRSPQTIAACIAAEESFTKMYGGALLTDNQHYYAIAKEGSRTSAQDFSELCSKYNLAHVSDIPPYINADRVEDVFRVPETLIDPDMLRTLCKKKLEGSTVTVHYDVSVTATELTSFDHIVVAAYAASHAALGTAAPNDEYQFEVCEKPVVKLPNIFAQQSMVVIDGPFMCFDPYGTTGYHVIGNVVHAIHATNVGKTPIIPAELVPVLNAGVITQPPVTRITDFFAAAEEFFPGFSRATHIGSMFTIRTVLPRTDATDERPTIVRAISDRITLIFSGKLVNCVLAARDVVTRLSGVQG